MSAISLATLRTEHARFHDALDRVEHHLRRPAAEPGVCCTVAPTPADPSAEMLPIALELVARVGAHLASGVDVLSSLFGRGDDGGLHRRHAELAAEHEELSSMLAPLVHTLDLPVDPRRDEQIAVQLRDLVDFARIHLRKEDALLLAASQPPASCELPSKGPVS